MTRRNYLRPHEPCRSTWSMPLICEGVFSTTVPSYHRSSRIRSPLVFINFGPFVEATLSSGCGHLPYNSPSQINGIGTIIIETYIVKFQNIITRSYHCRWSVNNFTWQKGNSTAVHNKQTYVLQKRRALKGLKIGTKSTMLVWFLRCISDSSLFSLLYLRAYTLLINVKSMIYS